MPFCATEFGEVCTGNCSTLLYRASIPNLLMVMSKAHGGPIEGKCVLILVVKDKVVVDAFVPTSMEPEQVAYMEKIVDDCGDLDVHHFEHGEFLEYDTGDSIQGFYLTRVSTEGLDEHVAEYNFRLPYVCSDVIDADYF